MKKTTTILTGFALFIVSLIIVVSPIAGSGLYTSDGYLLLGSYVSVTNPSLTPTQPNAPRSLDYNYNYKSYLYDVSYIGDSATKAIDQTSTDQLFKVSPTNPYRRTYNTRYSSTNAVSPITTKINVPVNGIKLRAEIITKESQRYAGGAGTDLYINGNYIYTISSLGYAKASTSQSSSNLLEVIPDLYGNTTTIYFGGIQRYNLTSSDPDVYVSFVTGQAYREDSGGSGSASLTIKDLRYQPVIGYTKDPQDILVIQTFSQGDVISLDSEVATKDFRFPVKVLPLATSIRFVSKTATTDNLDETYKIFSTLANGGQVTVPESSVWEIPYYIDNSQGMIPITCPDYYDADKGICSQMSGIVYALAEEALDTETLTVVATPESICEEATGSKAVSVDGETCVQPSSVVENCDEKTSNGQCVLLVSNICEDKDYTWNDETQSCETSIKVTETQEPIKSTSTGIYWYIGAGILALIAITMIIVGVKKRR